VTADPFAALAALAREEHRLVLDGHVDELAGLAERRATVLATLPDPVPHGALPHLREAARVQALVTVALREARDATAAELARVGRTRTGVQGYGGSEPAGFSRRVVDTAG
jgi:hypothetical protein